MGKPGMSSHVSTSESITDFSDLLPLPLFLDPIYRSIFSKLTAILSQIRSSPSDSTTRNPTLVNSPFHHSLFFLLVGGSGYGKTLLLRHTIQYFNQIHQGDVEFVSISAIEACQFYSLQSNSHLDFMKQTLSPLIPFYFQLKHLKVIVIDDIMQLGSFESMQDSRRLFLSNLYGTIRALPNTAPVVFLLSCHSQSDVSIPADVFPIVYELPLLTSAFRQQIFETMLGDLKVENLSLLARDLSQSTPGFTLQNIVDLIRQTILYTVASETSLSTHTWSLSDFQTSLQWIQPSLGISSAYTRSIPQVLLREIGGYEEVLKRLKLYCLVPMLHASAMPKLGIQPPLGILLYGPSGCGKTMLVRALASMSSLNVVHVKGPELFSKYLGESEQRIRNLFHEAQKNSPCILFFDEMDAIGVRRAWDSDQSGSVDDRVLSTILNEMDGIASRVGVMVIGCTHRPLDMDDALLRPGRIDHLIYVPMPSYEDRVAILQLTFPLSTRLTALAQQMEGCTPADLSFLIREASVGDSCTIEELEKVWELHGHFYHGHRRKLLEEPFLEFQKHRKVA